MMYKLSAFVQKWKLTVLSRIWFKSIKPSKPYLILVVNHIWFWSIKLYLVHNHFGFLSKPATIYEPIDAARWALSNLNFSKIRPIGN